MSTEDTVVSSSELEEISLVDEKFAEFANGFERLLADEKIPEAAALFEKNFEALQSKYLFDWKNKLKELVDGSNRKHYLAVLVYLYQVANLNDFDSSEAQRIRGEFLRLVPSDQEEAEFYAVLRTKEFVDKKLAQFETQHARFLVDVSLAERGLPFFQEEKRVLDVFISTLARMEKEFELDKRKSNGQLLGKLKSAKEKYVERCDEVEDVIAQKLKSMAEAVQKPFGESIASVVPQLSLSAIQLGDVKDESKNEKIVENTVLSEQDFKPREIKYAVKMGFVERYNLRKKLESALDEGNLADVAAIDYHFRKLVADEIPLQKKIKSHAFRKKLRNSGHYLDVLKMEFQLASEENNQQVLSELGVKLFRKLDREYFAELIENIQTPQHLKKQLDKLESLAKSFRAVDFGKKDDVALSDEEKVLDELIGFLEGLKNKVTEKSEKRGGHFVKRANQHLGVPVSPGPQQLQPRTVIENKFEKDLSEKIEFHKKRKGLLGHVKNKRDLHTQEEAQKEKEVETFRAHPENKKRFSDLLTAIPGKPLRLLFLGQKSRKPFNPKMFVDTLTDMYKSVSQYSDDATRNNEIFFRGMVELFKGLSRFKLKRLIEDLNHPRFKNFYSALDYYVTVSEGSNVPNAHQVGLKGVDQHGSDGFEEQRAVLELQMITSAFIQAFHTALDEKKIRFVDYFNGGQMKTQAEIFPENLEFISNFLFSKIGAGALEKMRGETKGV